MKRRGRWEKEMGGGGRKTERHTHRGRGREGKGGWREEGKDEREGKGGRRREEYGVCTCPGCNSS